MEDPAAAAARAGRQAMRAALRATVAAGLSPLTWTGRQTAVILSVCKGVSLPLPSLWQR